MSGARDAILGDIKRALKRGDEADAAGAVEARLGAPRRGPIPARAQLPHDGQVSLFETWATEQDATVARLPDLESVPAAVADYLKQRNLPARLRLAPDPELQSLPWRAGALAVEVGRAQGDDEASVTGAFAGIAETGTLMIPSGATRPTTLNFLPDTAIVVLRASQVVGSYEDAWDRLRPEHGAGELPRTVNFITGPSRTADIEQSIALGAHGPRRLHILLIEDTADGGRPPGEPSGDGA